MLCQFCYLLKLLAPPRVEILLVPHKIYSEPRRIFMVCSFFMVCKLGAPIMKGYRASRAFADHNEYVKRYHASWFRRIFTRYE